ncbi:acetyltransferase, GNAT family [Bacillus sp. ZZV12-4809]|nr:acetyltransferase, GNAT family [Bacillus sp. ZZV12-4809]
MVVGVATCSEFKEKGYATQCMVKLCCQLHSENVSRLQEPSINAAVLKIFFGWFT